MLSANGEIPHLSLGSILWLRSRFRSSCFSLRRIIIMMILVIMMMIKMWDDHKIRINRHLWLTILQDFLVVAALSRAVAIDVLYNTSHFNSYFASDIIITIHHHVSI